MISSCWFCHAVLYVVGAALPKTDFLTKIDIIIVLTTLSLGFTGLASLVLANIHSVAGEEEAAYWNWMIEAGFIGCHALVRNKETLCTIFVANID